MSQVRTLCQELPPHSYSLSDSLTQPGERKQGKVVHSLVMYQRRENLLEGRERMKKHEGESHRRGTFIRSYLGPAYSPFSSLPPPLSISLSFFGYLFSFSFTVIPFNNSLFLHLSSLVSIILFFENNGACFLPVPLNFSGSYIARGERERERRGWMSKIQVLK